MKRDHYLFYLLCAMLAIVTSCHSDADTNSLTVDTDQLSFGADGGTQTVNIKTNAPTWSISNPLSDWLTISPEEGTGTTASITFTVKTRTLTARTGTVVISAGSAKPVEITVTQTTSDHLYKVTTDVSSLSYAFTASTKTLKITTDATSWSIAADNADWLQFTQTTGNTGTVTINIGVKQNLSATARTATINLTATDAGAVQIAVTQAGLPYPNYNTSPQIPDQTGMSSNAVTLAAKMNLGWNIGNTLEAIGGETAWGNPKVTKALIDLVKQSGFNAVRIPCSWDQYMQNSSTAQLKTDWLNRVKEVVQYCVDNDMYVVLNIHWDDGWLENNVTTDKQLMTNLKQKAFWEQIATTMRDFDEHVLFASANEPAVDNADQMAVLLSYHQTFIDAVRSTGGRNSYRVLVVQGPSTDITKTHDLMTSLPVDQADHRLMVEVHYYTPYNFCLMTEDASWGSMFYYWGSGYHSITDPSRNATFGEEDGVDADFKTVRNQFVDNGIPVILGEYAAIRRTDLDTPEAVALQLASRAYYLNYVTKQAKANGMIPFYWDAGSTANQGTGLFDRTNNTVFDQQALDAIIQAGN